MSPDVERAANDHIASIFGESLKLNPEIARAMQLMYEFGRHDTFDALGIDESDLPTGTEAVAWSA